MRSPQGSILSSRTFYKQFPEVEQGIPFSALVRLSGFVTTKFNEVFTRLRGETPG